MAEDSEFTWGHVNINVSSLERSVAFYEKLGFSEFLPSIPYLAIDKEVGVQALPAGANTALGLPQGTRGRACIMQLGKGFPKIDLTEFPDLEQAKPLANKDLGAVRLCLLSKDLDSAYTALCKQEVEFLSEPQDGEGGMVRIATCVDPDGTLIELLEIRRDKWPR